MSQAQRQPADEWFDHTLYSRLNDKRRGGNVLIMHRLHESLPRRDPRDDLVGHVQAQEPWEVWFATHDHRGGRDPSDQTPLETRIVTRARGEALRPEREPLVAPWPGRARVS